MIKFLKNNWIFIFIAPPILMGFILAIIQVFSIPFGIYHAFTKDAHEIYEELINEKNIELETLSEKTLKKIVFIDNGRKKINVDLINYYKEDVEKYTSLKNFFISNQLSISDLENCSPNDIDLNQETSISCSLTSLQKLLNQCTVYYGEDDYMNSAVNIDEAVGILTCPKGHILGSLIKDYCSDEVEYGTLSCQYKPKHPSKFPAPLGLKRTLNEKILLKINGLRNVQ